MNKEHQLVPLGVYYEYRKLKLLLYIFHQPDSGIMVKATLDIDFLRPHVYASRRVGRPRFKWTAAALDLYWLIIRDGTPYKYTSLDWDGPNHEQLIRNGLIAKFLPKPYSWPWAAQSFTPHR